MEDGPLSTASLHLSMLGYIAAPCGQKKSTRISKIKISSYEDMFIKELCQHERQPTPKDCACRAGVVGLLITLVH